MAPAGCEHHSARSGRCTSSVRWKTAMTSCRQRASGAGQQAGLVAHNALLRGGEVGRVERRDFSADHGLTFSQIESLCIVGRRVTGSATSASATQR
jgi:hypothetical protein